ncbi:MAG: plasmid pRiA4b ORF-3 family protein [Planctomycetes bacterium]|nr:plasmid pRiA4b ORF-3 family protein [Planctomycetota bacterium]
MVNISDQVYQFKVTLKRIKPPIWRRIQVPATYTFWDLHVAIQDSMGWTDTHLHHFEILNLATGMKEEVGIPDEDAIENIILAGWKKNISHYFTSDNNKAEYVYDYGDNWEHEVKLEKILPAVDDIQYPICIAGKRECPPEDCGGPWCYEDFLKAIMDPKHEMHEELLDWVGGEFDPEYFNKDEIDFDDPKHRLEFMLND